jgi:peptidoglycan/xylan/chitin deacetylase (PgdA/CDA1 family)
MIIPRKSVRGFQGVVALAAIAAPCGARAAIMPYPVAAAQPQQQQQPPALLPLDLPLDLPLAPAVPQIQARSPVRDLAGAAAIIRRVETQQMVIAITFDACATNRQANGFDLPVLRVLQRERVPATIFTSGRWVEFHPAAMKQLAAEPLIEFANHSYDHPHMARLTADAIGDELDRTEAALGRYGRQSVAFRPPFGDFNQLVLEVAREKQLPAVLWDVVSGDPSARATAEAMIRNVVRDTMPGSIVIFHINGRETKTAEALPPIFRQLRARGFEFVHISTLLASRIPAETPTPLSVAADPGAHLEPDAIMPLSKLDLE